MAVAVEIDIAAAVGGDAAENAGGIGSRAVPPRW